MNTDEMEMEVVPDVPTAPAWSADSPVCIACQMGEHGGGQILAIDCTCECHGWMGGGV